MSKLTVSSAHWFRQVSKCCSIRTTHSTNKNYFLWNFLPSLWEVYQAHNRIPNPNFISAYKNPYRQTQQTSTCQAIRHRPRFKNRVEKKRQKSTPSCIALFGWYMFRGSLDRLTGYIQSIENENAKAMTSSEIAPSKRLELEEVIRSSPRYHWLASTRTRVELKAANLWSGVEGKVEKLKTHKVYFRCSSISMMAA
jgi:hypothetical protein